MGAVARMEHVGIPIDRDGLDRIVDNWDGVKRYYIRRDDEFGLFDEGRTFQLPPSAFETPGRAQGGGTGRSLNPGSSAPPRRCLGKQALRYPQISPDRPAHFRRSSVSRISSLTNTIGADEA